VQFDHFYNFDKGRSKRVSSWDQRGKNRDYITIEPGEERVLADIRAPGRINRLYCVVFDPTMLIYRKMVLRAFWDDETEPSVEVPLGDFFCVSHCMPRTVDSLLVTVNPGNGGKWCPVSFGLASYFPMPFSKRARITLEYSRERERENCPLMFWYHIDYEETPESLEVPGRFHAQWRREKLTHTQEKEKKNRFLWDGANLSGDDNYMMLEARGMGQVVGLHLQVDNIVGGWWGEGDDMIFIDGEKWPPSLHGTGTEEIFAGGPCPSSEFSGAYTGFHLIENENFSGKNGMYRWYVGDPIKFSSSIRMSIEHGHANNFENDYSSVAYWYQTEPHGPFPRFPAVEDRLPRVDESLFEIQRRIAKIISFQKKLEKRYGESDAFGLTWKFIGDGAQAVYEKRYSDALGTYDTNIDFLEKYCT
jgi:hypothetical protein